MADAAACTGAVNFNRFAPAAALFAALQIATRTVMKPLNTTTFEPFQVRNWLNMVKLFS